MVEQSLSGTKELSEADKGTWLWSISPKRLGGPRKSREPISGKAWDYIFERRGGAYRRAGRLLPAIRARALAYRRRGEPNAIGLVALDLLELLEVADGK